MWFRPKAGNVKTSPWALRTCDVLLTISSKKLTMEDKSSHLLQSCNPHLAGLRFSDAAAKKRYDTAAAAFSGKNRCCCLEVSSVRTLPHHSSTFRTLKNVFSESVDALTGYRLTWEFGIWCVCLSCFKCFYAPIIIYQYSSLHVI